MCKSSYNCIRRNYVQMLCKHLIDRKKKKETIGMQLSRMKLCIEHFVAQR